MSVCVLSKLVPDPEEKSYTSQTTP